jgi:hypothetical protein
MEVSDDLTLRQPYSNGKTPRFPLNRILGGSQKSSGSCGEDDISCLSWDLNPNFSVTQPLAIATDLSQLPMLGVDWI